MSYRIAAPDQYLAVTGMGIKTVKITKATWVWPLQRCMRFSVQPHDYAMNLQAMTKEKLQFLLPVVFTVGPDVNQRGDNSSRDVEINEHGTQVSGREDAGDSLMKFAMLLAETSDGEARAGNSDTHLHVENIVKGIIEGETRVLVSSMTMEEIFTEREVFKRRIFKNIQSELDQFGLKIYNANVKELRDAPNSIYFESLSRKAHEGAVNTARVDVAEAQLRGNVGEADRQGKQEREIAKINAETAVLKTDRDLERSTALANLEKQQASLKKDVDIAKTEAARAHESRDEDLRREVQVKHAAAEMERLRAKDVVRATIVKESKQQEADAEAYAERARADADAYAERVKADVTLYAKQKEAEGMCTMAEAYGRMAMAFGGPAGLLQYMMLEKGTYQELAHANAQAIQGLQPKISVWNTGNQSGGEGSGGSGGGPSGTETMRNVYQMLPPLMTTINEQTGITLPEWQFGQLGAGVDAMQQEKAKQPPQQPKVNGAEAASSTD